MFAVLGLAKVEALKMDVSQRKWRKRVHGKCLSYAKMLTQKIMQVAKTVGCLSSHCIDIFFSTITIRKSF